MEWIPVKSGWLYEQRSGLALLRGGGKWIPRWVVIYGEPLAALGIYEQRSDALPPSMPLRHIDLVGGTEAFGDGDGHERDGEGNVREGRRASWFGRLLGSRRRMDGEEEKVNRAGSISNDESSKVADTKRECTFTILRPADKTGQGAIKLTFRTASKQERDEWLTVLRKVINRGGEMMTMIGPNQTTILSSSYPPPLSQTILHPSHNRQSNPNDLNASLHNNMLLSSPQHDREALVYDGVTIWDGRTVARIKARANGRNPLIPPSATSSILHADQRDSIVGEELNYRYQQAILDRCKKELTRREIDRLEIVIFKLVGHFQSLVCRRLQRIVDEYHHCGGGTKTIATTNTTNNSNSSTGGVVFEEGPLRIVFIADFARAEEETVNNAYGWMRQEMNAARWLTSQRRVPLHQPLMTVCEYKGFRALAMLMLPLSERGTLVMEPAAGLVDDSAMLMVREASMALNLLSSISYRMPDGRLVTLALPPTIEVHRITSNPNIIDEDQARTVMMMSLLKRPIDKQQQYGPSSSSSSPPLNLPQQQQANCLRKTLPGLYLSNVHDLMPAYPTSSEELSGLVFFRHELIRSLAPAAVAPGDLHPSSKMAVLKTLRDVRLPAFLARLDSLRLVPLDSDAWRTSMHRAGLNMALLGAIARHTSLPHVREAAEIEMLARTAKLVLRQRIRTAILHFREVQALRVEEELRAIIFEIVNGVLEGCGPIMQEEIVPRLEEHFNYRLAVPSSCPALASTSSGRNALLLALQQQCALLLKEQAYAREGPLELEDVVGVWPLLTDGGVGCFQSCRQHQQHRIRDILQEGEEGRGGKGEEMLISMMEGWLWRSNRKSPTNVTRSIIRSRRRARTITATTLSPSTMTRRKRWLKGKQEAILLQLAQIVLPAGESLWGMEGRRGAAAQLLCTLCQLQMVSCEWQDALRTLDLAIALAPPHHPIQIRLALISLTIRIRNPSSPQSPSLPTTATTTMASLGEKPAPVLRPMDELEKMHTLLLHRVERHFGLHHPLGLEVRLHLARLMEEVEEERERERERERGKEEEIPCQQIRTDPTRSVHQGGKQGALTLRCEALAIAFKMLGRRHTHSLRLLIEIADTHARLGHHDEAITAYGEALGLLGGMSVEEEQSILLAGQEECDYYYDYDYDCDYEEEEEKEQGKEEEEQGDKQNGEKETFENVQEQDLDNGSIDREEQGEHQHQSQHQHQQDHLWSTPTRSQQHHSLQAELMAALVCQWRAKGDYEMALEWCGKCRLLLDNHPSPCKLLEQIYEQQAELCQLLYASNNGSKGDGEGEDGGVLASLLNEDTLAGPIATHLQTAIDCYARLFDARRQRHDLSAADSERLLRLARHIVLLTLRLAPPAQRPAIRAAIRQQLFQRPSSLEHAQREANVRDLLVRMVTGSVPPRELVLQMLERAQCVATIADAQADLTLLLDLVQFVN